MTKPLTIFIYGRDGVGWSIDADRMHTEMLLRKAGFRLTRNPFTADIIHFVWWDQVYRFRYLRMFSRAKWTAVVTNTIREDTQHFFRLIKVVDVWIAANMDQYQWLQNIGVDVSYQPFYVDEALFRPLEKSKEQLSNELGINYKKIEGKLLIGSFQRDTISDLITPKWQKDPKLLVSLLSDPRLPKRNWVLVLAGPRRHWIIQQCQKNEIPYVYVGKIPLVDEDDLLLNNLDSDVMVKLYNLIDLYVVSSAQEGGPKSVIESILCQTPIISRRVGLAPDLICDRGLFNSCEEGVDLLIELLCFEKKRKELAVQNLNKAEVIIGFKNTINRWKSIFTLG